MDQVTESHLAFPLRFFSEQDSRTGWKTLFTLQGLKSSRQSCSTSSLPSSMLHNKNTTLNQCNAGYVSLQRPVRAAWAYMSDCTVVLHSSTQSGGFYFIHCWNDNDHLVLCSMTITHIISTCPTKYHLLTCSRWTDESVESEKSTHSPRTLLNPSRVTMTTTAVMWKATTPPNRKPKSEANTTAVVADGQQWHHPKWSDHHGYQL